MNKEQITTGENKMGVMPVNRLLVTMALPMMLSMLVQALYNIVDSIFVSRICEDALTAVSMAFPMQNLLIGLATGVAVGTNALLSKSLGEKNTEGANHIALHGVFLSLISYLLFLIMGLTIARIFFVLQGASDSIADYGYEYLTIVMCLSFGIYLEIIFERLLQATGKTLYTMFTQGAGAIINIIFDPLLIFGIGPFPTLGIRGAAVATVLGQIVAAILAITLNAKKNEDIHLNFRKFKLDPKAISGILYIGIPTVIMIAIGSVMTFSVNKILGAFTSTAVAVFGVYFKLQSFAFMPLFGMNNAMVPIAAYNYGARKPDRILKVVKLAACYATCIMVLAFVLVQCFSREMLLLFDASEEMIALGMPALRTISFSFLLAGVSIISSSFFQAMGNGIYSMLISILRQLVCLVPLAYLFAKTGDVAKVWLAWPIAELVSVAFGLYFLSIVYRKIIKPMYQ